MLRVVSALALVGGLSAAGSGEVSAEPAASGRAVEWERVAQGEARDLVDDDEDLHNITSIERLLRGLSHITRSHKHHKVAKLDVGQCAGTGYWTDRQGAEHTQAPENNWESKETYRILYAPSYPNRATGRRKRTPDRWRRRRSEHNQVDKSSHITPQRDLTFNDRPTDLHTMLRLFTYLHVPSSEDQTPGLTTSQTEAFTECCDFPGSVLRTNLPPPADEYAWYSPGLRETALFAIGAAAAAFVLYNAPGSLKTQAQVSSGPPDAVFCPISLELMVDPVTVVETGQTYERSTIKSWLYTHSTDPITNVELQTKKLVQNIALRKVIQTIDKQAPSGSLDWLLCPISLELMVDPVIVAETGQTYERATIESWLFTNCTDPITNVRLRSKKLVANIAIRNMVRSWQAQHPEEQAQAAAAAMPMAQHRPTTSRSAWIAAIGGGMRKGMTRSESTSRLPDCFGSSSTSSASVSGTGSLMPRRKALSFTDLVGLQTTQAAPVH